MTTLGKDHISVCVCTYRRSVMLMRLLEMLAVQETSNLFEISVVVVENDAGGPSRELVSQAGSKLGLQITYEVEPIRVIAAARNHAFRLARGNFIAMIDDDEFPPGNWLLTMYRAIRTFGVDGVLGPVCPFFEQQPPVWLTRAQFSGAPAYPTGTLLHWEQTYAGNALLKRELLSRHALQFDESFTTGGEDRAFFRDAMALGCRFVAVQEAAVYESVPPERWTKKYYLRRAVVNGYNAHRTDASEGWSISRISMPLKSAIAICVYALILPVVMLLGDHIWVSVLEKGGHHFSRLCAMFHVQLVKERGF